MKCLYDPNSCFVLHQATLIINSRQKNLYNIISFSCIRYSEIIINIKYDHKTNMQFITYVHCSVARHKPQFSRRSVSIWNGNRADLVSYPIVHEMRSKWQPQLLLIDLHHQFLQRLLPLHRRLTFSINPLNDIDHFKEIMNYIQHCHYESDDSGISERAGWGVVEPTY